MHDASIRFKSVTENWLLLSFFGRGFVLLRQKGHEKTAESPPGLLTRFAVISPLPSGSGDRMTHIREWGAGSL